MELIVIDKTESIDSLIDYLKDKEYVSYDCETTGLHKSSEVIGFSFCAEEDKSYYVVLSQWHHLAEALLPVVNIDAAKRLIEVLKTKSLIMHNAIFDCMIAENFFKIDLINSVHTDTMVLAHLLNENQRVALKELGKVHFGQDADAEAVEMKASVAANGGNLTKADYHMYKADSHIMGKYGAKDAWLTYMLFYKLVPELYDQDLDKFFYEEESMPLLKGPTYQLNTTGLKVDIEYLSTLKRTLIAECEEAKAFIYKEIHVHIKDKYPGTKKKDTFNIGSSSQLAWLLFGQLGLEFAVLTDAGKDICRSFGSRLPYTFVSKREFIYNCTRQNGNTFLPEAIVNGKKVRAKKIREPWYYIKCDKSILNKHSHRYKWIEVLLEYQRKTKLLNTYVEGIEERISYGIIQPGFKQTGTTSGRYSSSNPNFQNLPRDDKRIKRCIIPRPGRVFVGADYSQLEPRVFAYFSKDKRLLEAFKGEDDFYSVIGMEVYGKYDCIPRKDGSEDAFGIKYKKLRDLSKVIALASTYGATAHQLAPTTGKSIDATQEDIDSYFERFPGVKDMMLESHKMAMETGQVVNLFGRPRRMPEAKKIRKIYGNQDHGDLPYEARNMLNLAVNHRIQSTGASIVNRAMIKFYNDCKALGLDFKIVCQVHDSLIIECLEKDAEDISLLLQNAMETATVLEGISLEAIPKIGSNFAEV